MNVFDRPPPIASDAVHYSLYMPPGATSKAEAEAMGTLIQAYVQKTLPGHLWNRDPFLLKPTEDPDKTSEWILEGTMRVGDSIDDEWLVVWLLKKVSFDWDLLIS